MAFNKKTIRDVKLRGKIVLLRVDYNVPLNNDGQITDDYRIKKSLPTIEYLLSEKCKIIICAHLGRPEGKPNPHESLRHVAERLSILLKHRVAFAPMCTGPVVEQAVKAMKPGNIMVLENLRFNPGEEANDKTFAKQLASLADVFVQDGFGVVHRAHASTEAITHYLPSVAGLLLENEVDVITNVTEKPQRPLMAIVGGAKIIDKIGVLERFIDTADVVALGGALANTFLKAEGINIGKSLFDPAELPLAKQLLARARKKAKAGKFVFYLPQDGVVASKTNEHAHTRIVDWDAHVIADIESYPKRPGRESMVVMGDEMILDIGPFSGSFIAGAMQLSRTVVWSGTMGMTETEPLLHGPVGPFAHGTEIVVEGLLGQYGNRPFSLVGGGDTVGYVEKLGIAGSLSHVSTGGSASLELMAGKKLPGVEALQNK